MLHPASKSGSNAAKTRLRAASTLPLRLLLLGLLAGCGGGDDELEKLLSPAHLATLKPGSMVQVSSYDTTGGNNDRINIHAGQIATILDEEGPGVITRIWITIDSRDPHYLRRIRLRMFWDGEEEPSVDVPVGDFFGTGFGYHHYAARYLGMTSGGYYCYFPMPFRRHARIEVVNETGQEVYAFYYHINLYRAKQDLPSDVGTFHAQWRRTIRTTPGEDVTVLDARGRGHLAGLNLSLQPYRPSLLYLEGDEKFYVDGEEQPSTHGTGTEDYFTAGWYFTEGTFATDYHGLLVKDEETARIAAYRHHIPDPVPFRESLRVAFEHGHGSEREVDWASTAYWYQTEPHAPFPPMLPGPARIPLRSVVPPELVPAQEAERELPPGGRAEVRSTLELGAEWSGADQLYMDGMQPGDELTMSLDSLREGEYEVTLWATGGPGYGSFEVLHDDRWVAGFEGSGDAAMPYPVELGRLAPRNGVLELTLGLREKGDQTGNAIGLDGFQLVPVRRYIPAWAVVGPFPNERRSDTERFGLDTVYPPEEEVDLQASYQGKGGQTVTWRRYETPEGGYFTLWDKVEPYEFAITYAVCWIHSPRRQEVPLLLGSDDGAKVFLNGEELYRFLEVRIAAPDQDEIMLPLKPGWNELLLKIENNFGGYAFFARLPGEAEALAVRASPPETGR